MQALERESNPQNKNSGTYYIASVDASSSGIGLGKSPRCNFTHILSLLCTTPSAIVAGYHNTLMVDI